MGLEEIAVVFAVSDPGQNPNTRARETQLLTYFHAMAVAFSSVRRWNPDLRLTLVTGADVPAEVRPVFERCGVRTEDVPFGHRAPEGFMNTFSGCLYLLDALQLAARHDVLFIDPDVLCVDALTGLDEGAAGRLGALGLELRPDEAMNGLTIAQSDELHRLLGEPEEPWTYYGGEVYLVRRDLVGPLRERVERAWRLALERHAAGLPHFVTEEHLLSYALRGLPTTDLAPWCQRIWTTSRVRTVTGREDRLSLWHLPAEKDFGFQRLFGVVSDGGSWFWRAPRGEFVARAGRELNLHHRRPAKFLRDAAGQLVNRVAAAR